MSTQNQLPWSHSNLYSADSACVHCEGVIRHESWCLEQNADVQYAYQAVSEPDLLSLGDQVILHALGVAWTAKKRSHETAGPDTGRSFGSPTET
jgi:hypothetical protein